VRSGFDFPLEWYESFREKPYHGYRNHGDIIEPDLRNLEPFSDIILSDLDNSFYYEVNYPYHVPRHILRRSVLHGEDD